MILIVWGISAFISIPPLLGWKQSAPDLSWFHAIHSQKEALNVTSTEFGFHLAHEMSRDEFDNFTKALEDVVFPKCQVGNLSYEFNVHLSIIRVLLLFKIKCI